MIERLDKKDKMFDFLTARLLELVSEDIGVSVSIDEAASDALAVTFRNGKAFSRYSMKMALIESINSDELKKTLVIPLLCDLAKEKWLRKNYTRLIIKEDLTSIFYLNDSGEIESKIT